MNTQTRTPKSLIEDLHSRKDEAALDERLQQLLTPTELEEVANRLHIIQLLEQGMPQRKIAQTLGVGIATVSRGARALKTKQTD